MVDCADRDFSPGAGRGVGAGEGFAAGAVHLQFVLGKSRAAWASQ